MPDRIRVPDADRPGRRWFLKNAALAGLAVVTPFQALAARAQEGPPRGLGGTPGSGRGPSPDYGPLFPALDEATGLPLLLLPRGFRYVSFGWTGDLLSDGTPTPSNHDGMAAFPDEDGRILLVRNHEIGSGPDAFAPDLAYDPEAGGGTTTIAFDVRRGRYLRSWPSLSGTVRNCAGGRTPWNAWLSCEETLEGPGPLNDLTRKHGYVFEVPAGGVSDGQPLVDMGRFAHEAVAVDPATGCVYETEDAGDTSGFYRFVANDPGRLSEGGRLHMLAIAGFPQADTRTGQTGEPRPVEWVDIAEPDPADVLTNRVFFQGFAQGGARFRRLEGAF